MKKVLLTSWWGQLIASVLLLGVAYCWMVLATDSARILEYFLFLVFLGLGINRFVRAVKTFFKK